MTPKLTRILHLTDEHFPYHDHRSIALAQKAISIIRPHYLIFGGDLIDAPGVSRFRREPSTLLTLQHDLDLANTYISTCLKLAGPKCKTVFLIGNHEDRIQHYIDRHAPSFSSLRSLRIETLLRLPDRNIRVVRNGSSFRIGALTFIHGDLIRKWSGSSAHTTIDSFGCNIIMGHAHRFGTFTKRIGPRIYRGFETGCLCQKQPHYLNHPPDWHRGFSLFLMWGPRLKSFTSIPVWLDQPNPLSILETFKC